ncbi:MAG: DUF3782 domain-containing protein [Desulfobacteraceae bacterium]|nr:DUF3782 domain-containing protein [Desulfobacteraceae bacterium]
MELQQLKETILRELPMLIQHDESVRKYILNICKPEFPDRLETESRFDRILNELKTDREENQKKWDENQKKWDEKWAEMQKQSDEKFEKLLKRMDSSIGALGSRWGLYSEKSFRDGLQAILEDSFGVKVINVNEFDDEGSVFGRPDQVELDIIVKNSMLIICELKSSVSKSDMYIFERKVRFYEKRHNRKVSRMIVISPMVDEKAMEVAKQLQIEIYSYADSVKP